jgi:hypothetical protein
MFEKRVICPATRLSAARFLFFKDDDNGLDSGLPGHPLTHQRRLLISHCSPPLYTTATPQPKSNITHRRHSIETPMSSNEGQMPYNTAIFLF